MYARDFLRAGDFFEIVPLGLPLTLEYNENGNLHRIYRNWEGDMIDVTPQLLQTFLSTKIVPLRISLRSGTSWVKGVVYTSKNFVTEDNSNQSVQDMMLKTLQFDTGIFNFFAGYAETKAARLKGAEPIRRWLSMEGFHTLPIRHMRSDVVSAKDFDRLVNTSDYPFKYPLIMNLMVFRGDGFHIYTNELKQYIIRRVLKEVDDNGYIWSILLTTDKNFRVKIPYTDVINYNLNPGVLVVINEGGNVIYSEEVDGKHHDPRVNYINCTVCGKKLIAPKEGDMICTNKHCRSRMFPVFNHFLHDLGLPTIASANYKTYTKRGELLCLSDVFELPEYRGVHIKITADKLLRAIVPLTEISTEDVFTLFASVCNHNLHGMEYYMEHPDEINSETLMATCPDTPKLIEWLSDPENNSDVHTLFNMEQIEIVEPVSGEDTSALFDGPKIFQNKTLYLTGRFKHGNLTQMTAILKSYGARVVTTFVPNVDGVLVGDIAEGVNGAAIRSAKNSHIPVMEESAFFNEYGIDSDMSENLV